MNTQPEYIEVEAGVRYWEDATINGQEDTNGTLTPFRKGNDWCPVIRLSDGVIMDWPSGTTADVHFKVCDDGEYWLLDAQHQRIAKWAGYYVPDDFLCHGGNGYGDYIILKVDANGVIKNWRSPAIEWTYGFDDEDESGWNKLEGGAA